MKTLLPILCILSIIIISSPRLSAMDYDEAIPLKKISQKPSSLQQKFNAFEKKVSIELSQESWFIKKKLEPAPYIAQLHAELPEIFKSERTIEKFSRLQSSYFANIINELITQQGHNHYRRVTGDTLATVHKPEILQRCAILDGLPPHLKQYVMRKAYYTIKQEFVCIALGDDSDILDIHTLTHEAAVINKNEKTFQLWNLKTAKMIHVMPKASPSSIMRFSTDGSIIITTTVSSSNPNTTRITMSDRETKTPIKKFFFAYPIKNIFFDNEYLHIFDATGFLSIYKIDKKNDQHIMISRIAAGVQKMNPPFTFPGKYCIDNNAILRKSFAYFMCRQATKNTSTIKSLKKIYDTQFYNSDSLTQDQRKMINQKIKNKINDLSKKTELANTTMSWFG